MFTAADERAIRAVLKAEDWSGRWEGTRSGSPCAVWCSGVKGSRQVNWQLRRGNRLYSGAAAQLREALQRMDFARRADLSDIHEHYEVVEIAKATRKHVSKPHPTSPSNGDHSTLYGASPCKILQWCGAHGFSMYDALQLLEHHHLAGKISKKTVSRAMDKGKHPERDNIEVIDLPAETAEQLELFRDYARKEG